MEINDRHHMTLEEYLAAHRKIDECQIKVDRFVNKKFSTEESTIAISDLKIAKSLLDALILAATSEQRLAVSIAIAATQTEYRESR